MVSSLAQRCWATGSGARAEKAIFNIQDFPPGRSGIAIEALSVAKAALAVHPAREIRCVLRTDGATFKGLHGILGLQRGVST
jgi:hypothetical protein